MPEQDTESLEIQERQELKDRIWAYSQRGVVALVIFGAGVFAGYQLWGQAAKLQVQVEELNDKNANLVKERDTLRSKIALVERDKGQIQKRLEETQAKLAAATTEAKQAVEPEAAPAE